MKHFVSIQDLSKTELENLLEEADRRSRLAFADQAQEHPHLAVAALFFETSTRTRVSFELAARRLGAHFLGVDLKHSSQNKGETVWDTVATIQAMGVNQFIIRTSEVGLPRMLSERVNPGVSIINAGEANISHPSQALLDLVTLKQVKGDISKLSIAIVGDISHSRVARSFFQGARLLGCKDIRLVAPAQWQGSNEHFSGAEFSEDLEKSIDDVDVIMALRIQKERMQEGTDLALREYCARFSITTQRLDAARFDVLVMHPGPINRNVEISDEVADGPQSIIQQQVAIGVPARMAIIDTLARTSRGTV